MIEKILLTGFGPFGNLDRNISAEAVKRLDGTTPLDGFAVQSVVLPVQLERATELLRDAIETHRPAAVICCGVITSDPDAEFRLELAAKNERDYPLPDDDGEVVRGATVIPEGPAMVFSSLPVGAIKTALEESGLRVALSEDAGRYLCNAIFYWVVQHTSPAGFLHVPSDPTRLNEVVQALEIAARVTSGRLSAQRVEATL